MSRTLFVDLETASACDLKRAGAEKYFEHPSTRVLMMAAAFDDEPVFGFHLVDGEPQGDTTNAERALRHIRDRGAVVAHNAPFELPGINRLHRDYPGIWPALTIEATHCTMAMCRAMGLPGSLGEAAKALRLPVEKDADGHKLMLKLCKPRKPRRGEDQNAILWDHHTPEALARLLEYCKRDIEPERAIWNLLPKLSERERAYWILDRKINDRGVMVDLDGVIAAANATDIAKEELNDRVARLTRGRVSTLNQTAKILDVLKQKGAEFPDLRKNTVENALRQKSTRGFVRRLLLMRQEASRSSTAKLEAAINGACSDRRLRGTIEFHGAGTGRPVGKRFQPLNMLRPPKGFNVNDAREVIDWLKFGEPGARVVKSQYKSVISAVAYSMRSFIVSPPEKVLVAADYSNIEGRLLAWLGGEHWKLKAFADFDAGTGHDLYKIAYGKSFGVDPAEIGDNDDRRQIGKVQELALGYQGAHGAFLSMGKNYNVDLELVARTVRSVTPPAVWAEATDAYWRGAQESTEELLAARRLEAELDPSEVEPDFFDVMRETARKNRHGLDAEIWVALRVVVDGWRAAHPATVAFWRAIEAAAIEATEIPGRITHAGRLAYCKTGDFLMCRVPSGKKIAYPYARMEMVRSKWDSERVDKKLVFEGVNGKTKRWGKEYFYGGMGAENACQCTAFELLKDAQFRLEAQNLPIVLHVYDENVCEVAPREGLTDLVGQIMTNTEPWAAGLPVAVGKPYASPCYWKG